MVLRFAALVGLLMVSSSVVAAPKRLAAPGLTSVDVDPRRADFLVSYLADQLRQHDVAVTTAAEISAVLGVERQRQLLGCGDDTASCIAELSGALGVEAILIGDLAGVDGGTAITLKVVEVKGARTIFSRSGRFFRDGEVLDWLTARAPEIAAALGGEPQRAARPSAFTGAAPRHSIRVGAPAVVLGYEFELVPTLHLGLRVHWMYSPMSLRPSVFDLQAGGGASFRWDVLSAGWWGLSLGASAGYQALQSYDGFAPEATQSRIGTAGYFNPSLEGRLGNFSVGVEVPVLIPGTFTFNSGYLEAPVFPLFVTLNWRFRM